MDELIRGSRWLQCIAIYLRTRLLEEITEGYEPQDTGCFKADTAAFPLLDKLLYYKKACHTVLKNPCSFDAPFILRLTEARFASFSRTPQNLLIGMSSRSCQVWSNSSEGSLPAERHCRAVNVCPRCTLHSSCCYDTQSIPATTSSPILLLRLLLLLWWLQPHCSAAVFGDRY